jgi:hypothetical protein
LCGSGVHADGPWNVTTRVGSEFGLGMPSPERVAVTVCSCPSLTSRRATTGPTCETVQVACADPPVAQPDHAVSGSSSGSLACACTVRKHGALPSWTHVDGPTNATVTRGGADSPHALATSATRATAYRIRDVLGVLLSAMTLEAGPSGSTWMSSVRVSAACLQKDRTGAYTKPFHLALHVERTRHQASAAARIVSASTSLDINVVRRSSSSDHSPDLA